MNKSLSVHRFSVVLVVLYFAALGLAPTSVRAATFRVDRTDDTAAATACTAAANDCSLRGAISDANANVDADTINFSVTGTITLTNGELVIN